MNKLAILPSVGDIIHIKAVVTALNRRDTEIEGVEIALKTNAVIGIPLSEIVHIEPRPLAVGDTVKSFNYNSEVKFKILAIVDDKAWLKKINAPGPYDVVEPLDRLQRIE